METYEKVIIGLAVIVLAAAIAALVLGVLSYIHQQDVKNGTNTSVKNTQFENTSFDLLTLTGDVTGTTNDLGVIATTVQTNADLVGPIVFSTGNTTTVPNGVITNSMLATPPLEALEPTMQSFTVGGASGIYTLPLLPRKPLYLRVVMIGAGGGGAGSVTSGSAASGPGGNGTATSFVISGGGLGLSVDPGEGAVDDVGGNPGSSYVMDIGEGNALIGGKGSYADSMVFITNTGGGTTPISNITLLGGNGSLLFF